MARNLGVIGGAAVMILAGTCWADPDAVERLQSAAQALREARTLSYKVKISSKGAWEALSLKVDGSVAMRRIENQEHGWQLRREGTADVPTIGKVNYLVVSDDRTAKWIDHEKKSLIERYTASARDRQYTMAASAWLKQLAEKEPFAKDIAAPTTTLEGTEERDGVLCEIVLADYGENKEKYRWWLGATDHMPRKVEQILDSSTLKNVTTYELSEFRLNPELGEETFALKAPGGYSEERIPEPVPYNEHMAGAGAFEMDGVTPTPMMAAPLKIAQLPAFNLSGPGGQKVSSESLRGEVAVIDFWGTWCSPCKKSTPEVQALSERFKGQKVQVLGVAVRQKTHQEPIDYFKENKLTYQLLLDGDQFAKDCRVTKYPTFIVAGFDGEVLAYKESFKVNDTFAEITEIVQKYLDSGGTEKPSNAGVAGADGDGADDRSSAAATGDGTTTSSGPGGTTTTTPKPKGP